jgi:L-amino acid N-acyltransferase YncA
MTITTTIAIRPAKIEDAPAIAHVHNESWKTTYAGIVPASFLANLDTEARTGMWREQLANGNSIIFVAEAASDIVGFVCGGPLREPLETYDAELYAIYLLQEQQQQGTGRLLIHTLATTLLERNFTRMLLWVLAQNPATSFYKHLGAIEIAQKQIEIGGATLEELAFGWTDLHPLVSDKLQIKPA